MQHPARESFYMTTAKRILPLLLSLLLLAGCAKYTELPAGTRKEITSAIVDQQPVVLPPPLAGAATTEYRVGPGDVLAIKIPGRPESVAAASDPPQGFRVYSSGKVMLPLVGGVAVAGLSVDEIQAKLQEIFKPYLREPVITVEILEFKSQSLYLLGKFNQPGVKYLDRPVSLIQGISLGGSFTESADLRGARLVRGNEILPVDIYELVFNNDLRQNIPLQSGDTIFVPGNEQQNVFVFGAVQKEGQIPMVNGRLSLPQALSIAGLGKGSYDRGHIRIIRSHSPTRGELLVIDLDRIMSGEALPLPLLNGDVVYVPRSGVGDWNQALSEILPTLQAVSAILQPFVQIHYLTDDDD
jgi:polysaccharide export outer membrane protein